MRYVVGYRRVVIEANLRRSFPTLDDAQIGHLVREFYRHFADVIIESLKAVSIRRDQILPRLRLTNPELVEQHLQEGQSVMVLASHQGNWEWCLIGFDAYLKDYQVDAVYQPIKNPKFDALMRETRSKFGARLVPMRQTVRHIIKHRHETVLQAIVADQSPGRNDKKAWVRFLNQDTAFFQGIEKIAEMTEMPVYYVAMRREKRGYYALTFRPIAAPPYQAGQSRIMERYAEQVELAIAEAPAHWLWSHKRWKHLREEGDAKS